MDLQEQVYALQRVLERPSNSSSNQFQQTKDFLDSIIAINHLSKQRSNVSLSIKPKKYCLACKKELAYETASLCKCSIYYHEKCLYQNTVQLFENLMEQLPSSIYRGRKNTQFNSNNKESIICSSCNTNVYFQVKKVNQKFQKFCTHQQCKKEISVNDINYQCRCGNAYIHIECFISQYLQNNCSFEQVKCEGCLQEIELSELELDKIHNEAIFPCKSCLNKQYYQYYQSPISTNQQLLFFKEIIFCRCSEIYCVECLYIYLKNQAQDYQFNISSIPCQHTPNCYIGDFVLNQFNRTNKGIMLQNEINDTLTHMYLSKQSIHTCPGFLLIPKDTNMNTDFIQQKDIASAQKYITMKRQAEDDPVIKKEYEAKLEKLQEKYIIKACNNKFQIDFKENQRIFVCNQCGYRDCKDQSCKSPHFNLTCEMFQKLNNFKKNQQQQNKPVAIIYKIKYEENLIIVDDQFVKILKQNPQNQIQIIEQITNPFFTACNLPLDMFDPNYDRDWFECKKYTNIDQTFRGRIIGRNIQYNYPKVKNLLGYGINIEKLYGPQNSLKWLSRDTDEDTFIVGFHGTRSIAAVQGIIANGFQAGGGQAYANHQCPYTNTKVGVGVYFGASVQVAHGYTSPIQLANNEIYRIIFQCRLNSRTVKGAHSINTVNEYYIVNDPKDIRIYRILLIKDR